MPRIYTATNGQRYDVVGQNVYSQWTRQTSTRRSAFWRRDSGSCVDHRQRNDAFIVDGTASGFTIDIECDDGVQRSGVLRLGSR
jgi:hypothetical protein